MFQRTKYESHPDGSRTMGITWTNYHSGLDHYEERTCESADIALSLFVTYANFHLLCLVELVDQYLRRYRELWLSGGAKMAINEFGHRSDSTITYWQLKDLVASFYKTTIPGVNAAIVSEMLPLIDCFFPVVGAPYHNTMTCVTADMKTVVDLIIQSTQNKIMVKFKILVLPEGSPDYLKKEGEYYGHKGKSNVVTYNDTNGVSWIFHDGKTCEVINHYK